MKKVNIEDIVPYMDETPLTDNILDDMGFEKKFIPVEKSGDEEDYWYYYLELYSDISQDLALLSTDNNKDKTVHLFPYDEPVFNTKGSVEMFLILMKGDVDGTH